MSKKRVNEEELLNAFSDLVGSTVCVIATAKDREEVRFVLSCFLCATFEHMDNTKDSEIWHILDSVRKEVIAMYERKFGKM